MTGNEIELSISYRPYSICDSVRDLRTTNVLNLRGTRKFYAAESRCRGLFNRSFLTADATDGTDESQCDYL